MVWKTSFYFAKVFKCKTKLVYFHGFGCICKLKHSTGGPEAVNMWHSYVIKWPLTLVTGRFGPIPVRTPGRFGPIPFQSGRFGLGRFGPILEVGRFNPVLVAHFILYRF